MAVRRKPLNADPLDGTFDVSIQDLGSIGELVGALATVATLIYLATQIRQNTALQRQNLRALELAATDGSARYGADLRKLFLENEDLLDVWVRGCEDTSALDRQARIQFGLLAESLFFGDQAVWVRVNAGVLSAAAIHVPVIKALERPGVAAWWERNRSLFDAAYADSLDAARQRAV